MTQTFKPFPNQIPMIAMWCDSIPDGKKLIDRIFI
jgi:hypothetical protein